MTCRAYRPVPRLTALRYGAVNLLLGSLLMMPAALVTARGTVLRAGGVVDVARGQLLPNMSVLVRDGLIVAMAEHIEPAADAEVIDLGTAILVPGLMDAHTHLVGAASTEGDRSGATVSGGILESSASLAIVGVANARSMLESGFATIRDLGSAGESYPDLALARAIRMGWVPGPKMIAAGKTLSIFAGHHSRANPELPNLPEYDHAITRSSDDIRETVREQIQYGATVIKLMIDPARLMYSEEEVRVAVTEAHRAGVKVAAHAIIDPAVQIAIRGGVDSVEHAFYASEATLKLMKERGTWLVDTTGVNENATRVPSGAFKVWLERLEKANDLGVPIGYGSDAFWFIPGRTRGEVALDNTSSYIKVGIPPRDILRFMTINNARLLGIDTERGSLDVGKAADIIAVSGNPLQDVEALRQVSFVMKDGRIYKRDGMFLWDTPRVLRAWCNLDPYRASQRGCGPN